MMQASRFLRFGAVAAFLVTFGVTFGVSTAAAEGKIGIIDSQRIFSEYQEAKDAEAIFQQEMQEWQKELEGQERQIVAQQEKIRSQSLLLTKDKLDEMQRALDTLVTAYERQKSEILDPNGGRAVRRNQELSKPINDQITLVVERIGSEGAFDVILDVATVNVVYLADGVDLTDQVLEELGKTGN